MVFSTAFAAVDHPIVLEDDLGERRMVDTLSLSHMHSEAVKSMVIWRDTLRAERLWRDIVGRDSAYAPALYSLSRLDGTPDGESLLFAERAYNADSSNKWYAQNYGMMLVVGRDYERALGVYKRLMSIDKRDASTYYYLANIYRIKGMPYSAISVLDSAELRMGRNPYLARVKQELLLETMQYDKAITEGERLLHDTPYDVEAHLELAQLYDAAGRDSLAQSTFERAYQLDSLNVNVIIDVMDYNYRKRNFGRVFELSEAMIHSDRLTEEVKIEHVKYFTRDLDFYSKNIFYIGKLISLLTVKYPTNRDVVELQATHLFLTLQHEEALSYFREHLYDDNVEPRDFILSVQMREVLGTDDGVAEDIARAMKLFPDNIDVVLLAAYQEFVNGNPKGALRIYRKAFKHITDDKNRSLLWGSIGDVHHELGDDDDAFKAYRKALEYNAENALVLNNYAYFLSLRDEELERALAMAQLAVTLESDNYNYVDTYAWILHLMGRNDEAKKHILRALSLSGQQDATIMVHYADILWELGEKFMAETYWKRAVERGYDADELKQHVDSKMKSKD